MVSLGDVGRRRPASTAVEGIAAQSELQNVHLHATLVRFHLDTGRPGWLRSLRQEARPGGDNLRKCTRKPVSRDPTESSQNHRQSGLRLV